MILDIVLPLGMIALLWGIAGLAYTVWLRNARDQVAGIDLEVNAIGAVSGVMDGFAVVYERSDHPVNPCLTRVELGFQLPPLDVRKPGAFERLLGAPRGLVDVELPALTALQLRVRAQSEADVTALLNDPDVLAGLRAVLGTYGNLEITDRQVCTRAQPPLFDHVPVKVERALVVARAIRAAFERPWTAAGERLGLEAADTDDARVLEGVVDDISVRVEQARLATGEVPLRVRVGLPRPLPPGTELVHIDRGKGPSAPLNDLILGAQVHVLTTDPEALSARLSRDAVRGPLLEVVHGHPGSKVTSEAVQLLVLPAPLDPAPAISLALELGRALGEVPSSS